MNVSRIGLAALSGLLFATTCQDAPAQLHKYSGQINRLINTVQAVRSFRSNTSHRGRDLPRYHGDHHEQLLRVRHGHVGGPSHRNVLHRDATYILPHSGRHLDTYHVRNGCYYYTPRTASLDGTRFGSPVQIEFGSFSHVDDLAVRLEELTNEFLLDLHYNYRHNYGFHETYAEGYQLLQVARFIHDAEHAHDRAAIRSQLRGMDALFHHLQDDVRGWTRAHHRQVGQPGILSRMDLIEATLHHLMNDVGVENAPPPVAGGAPPQPGGMELAPPPSPRP
jgi:hypothetical protein